MRDVKIIRGVLSGMPLWGHQLGFGRIYDDVWPLNVAGVYCTNLTRLIKSHLDALYPDGWDATNSIMLYTTRYPYSGRWHEDSGQYPDDTICLLCVDGYDELEYVDMLWHESGYMKDRDGSRYKIPWANHANLRPGDILLMPAATWHRGRCSTNRITYHVRVGPKGRTMPESLPDRLPPMTFKRFIRRTLSTLSYYLLRLPEDHPWCERYKWIVPRVRRG